MRPRAKEGRLPLDAGEAETGSVLVLQSETLPAPRLQPTYTASQTSRLYLKIKVCGFKPPTLWKFVTAGKGN